MEIDFSKLAEQHVKTIKKHSSNILDMNKSLANKSAKEFEQDIESGKLYAELKPKKK